MLNYIKKKMVSMMVKSYMTRFAVIDGLYKDGRLSQSEYNNEKQKVIGEYREFLRDTPAELIPDFAKKVD